MGDYRRRRILALAFSLSLANAAFVAACVSDSGGTSGGGDSGSDASTTGDQSTTGDGQGTVPTATTSDTTVYVGNSATLDGSASTPAGASFSWSLKSAPSGSAITTASLQNANGSKVTLTPDLPGDYVVTLTVTASGGSASSNATVHATPGKTFYVVNKQLDGGKTLTEVHYVHTDGTGDTAITCPAITTPGIGTLADSVSESSGVDWIEGAPADEAKVAFGFIDNLPDGGEVSYIGAGTTVARCDGIHTIGHVDVVPTAALPPQGIRISPDGSRIAYLRNTTTFKQMTTIGFDGNDMHSFGGITFEGGTPNTGPSYYAPPRWIDATHVAWLEITSQNDWRIMTAADVAGPTPGTYMTCTARADSSGTSTAPGVREFEMLPDGSVLAAIEGGPDASSSFALVVYKPNASTNHCDFVRQLTASASDAVDFAVSPDKTRVAFVSVDPPSKIMVVPLDGSSAPVALAQQPQDGGAYEGAGPHWAANGGWLVWGSSGTPIGAPNNSVVGASPAGNGFSVIAAPDASDTSYNAVGNSCSASPARNSNDFAFYAFGGALALAVGRRRKKNRVR